ncbi:MAG: hypothetical protein E5V71_14165 [Mesorhizobium sp.]|nr:MAG: hypothetical protein E5V71_14165 [Mesorhizobium sp.]
MDDDDAPALAVVNALEMALIAAIDDFTKTFPGVKALSNVNLSVEAIRNTTPPRSRNNTGVAR